jgi:hypothetical protein
MKSEEDETEAPAADEVPTIEQEGEEAEGEAEGEAETEAGRTRKTKPPPAGKQEPLPSRGGRFLFAELAR